MKFSALRATLAALAVGTLVAAPAQALVMTATNNTSALLDGTSAVRTVTLGGGVVTKVTVFVDLTKCATQMRDADPSSCEIPNLDLNNPFSFPEEILLRLTNPGGLEISLVESFPNPTFDPNFDPNSIRLQLTFDDAAADIIGGPVLPSSGSFKPIESLALLNVPTAAGDWALYIEDTESGDPLAFHSFTLNVTVDDQQTRIPEPGTLALLGLGLAGFGILRGRRRG